MADLSPIDLGKLKVAELKKLLKEKNLSITGNKAELIQRLQDVGVGPEAEPEDDDLNDISDDVLNEDLDEVEELDKDDKDKENEDKENEVKTDIAKPEDPLPEEPPKPKTVQPISPPTEDEKVQSSGLTKTPEEKLADRSKRFGVMSDDSKKKLRSERFGVQTSSGTSPSSTEDVDKMKKRAERFGAVTSPSLAKEDSKVKLDKRAERFGMVTSPTAAKDTETEKLLKRKAKFGSPDQSDELEAKRKARAERFEQAK